MPLKKRGLGKGLDAIFAENTAESTEGAVNVKISEIEPNREQPRKEFDSEALSELADSISQHGGADRGARGYPGDDRRRGDAFRPH